MIKIVCETFEEVETKSRNNCPPSLVPTPVDIHAERRGTKNEAPIQ